MLSLFILLAITLILSTVAVSNVGKNFSIVLVGGGLLDDNEQIWGTIISLGGGKGVARLGVVAAAGGDPCCGPDSSFFYYNEMLTQYGAAEVYYIPVTVDSKEMNSDSGVVEKINDLTGFFFSGGDQQRVITSLYNDDERTPSPVLVAIRRRLLEVGGVVAGSSAGTDCQTVHPMMSGGISYNALVEGTHIFWRSKNFVSSREGLAAYGPGGIGLFPHGLVDTHFANRGRQGRMIQLLMDTAAYPSGATVGFGIDENTALVVTGPWQARQAMLIGQRGAVMFDVSHATREAPYGQASRNASLTDVGPQRTPSSFSNVLVTRMSEGDVIDFNTLQVTPAPFKTSMGARESNKKVATTKDVFGEDSFQYDEITSSLFKSTATSTYGVTKEQTPIQFEVRISKVKDECVIQAEGFDGTDPATGLYAYSYRNMWLDITY
jgi:cyanophycinase